MPWTGSTYAMVVVGSSVLSLVVGIEALRRRPDPLAWPLAVMMFAVTAWAIPHAVSLGYRDVGTVAAWHVLRHPGTEVAPLAFLALALRYAGYERWVTRRALFSYG
ncbi:MAG: histidine kinase N-terminal 7TM domain-containing protein [Halobacteriaceae archaeon]